MPKLQWYDLHHFIVEEKFLLMNVVKHFKHPNYKNSTYLANAMWLSNFVRMIHESVLDYITNLNQQKEKAIR